MASDLESRVTTLERTVASEIRERMRMSQDIGEVKGLITKRSEAQRRMLQAVGDTQSEHSALLRDVRRTVDRMAPKVDVIETQVAGTSTRMGILEGQMGALEGQIGALGNRMDRKVDALAEDMNGKIDALAEDMNGKIDALAEDMNGKFATIIGMLDSRK